MTFQEILRTVSVYGDGLRAGIPDNWRQGRTGYGGLTAALCLHAARELTGVARPLRSAMVSFVGPSMDNITLSAETLRTGKNITTVAANLHSDGVPATQTILSFADLRKDSVIDIAAPTAADIFPPTHIDNPVQLPPFVPVVMHNFDICPVDEVLPFTNREAGLIRWWARHRAPEDRAGELSLMCIADLMPPATTAVMSTPAPLSSITWMVNMLQEKPTTEDGWWLLEVDARHAAGGYSSQTMTIWNTSGECVVTGAQMVTVFA